MDFAVLDFFLLLIAGALVTWSDLRRGLIPNWLNLAIAAVGLSKATILYGYTVGITVALEGLIIGAIAWLLRKVYFAARKRQGLGLGDVKLLAASAIWVGVAGIPVQLLVASLTALAAAGVLQVAGQKMIWQTSLPFGPFLALGLLIAFAFQQ